MAEFQLQEGSHKVFLRLSEIGLVLLLFTDASRTALDASAPERQNG